MDYSLMRMPRTGLRREACAVKATAIGLVELPVDLRISAIPFSACVHDLSHRDAHYGGTASLVVRNSS